MKAKQLGYGLRRIENVELQEPNQVSFLRARAMAAGFLLVKESDSDSEDGGKSKEPAPKFHTILGGGTSKKDAAALAATLSNSVLTDKDKVTSSEELPD